ncbi:MAG TPA: hypothetical protein VLV55_00535 [Rhizomicrobium sp.]|nr:hypothetical protein [Rhizomicrobium sp.]
MRSLPDILYNFHWVLKGEIARSAQAWAGFLKPFLKRHRIATVINLRGHNPRWSWWHKEKRDCDAIGVHHYDVKLNSRRLPSRALLLDMLEAFDDAKRPILLKCSGGQDRTSFAAALYLLHTRGLAAREAADAQFARWPYLHLPRRQQRWLKAFLTFAQEGAGTQKLREWIATTYSPEDFSAWLDARGLGSTFKGLQGPPRIPAPKDNARHKV